MADSQLSLLSEFIDSWKYPEDGSVTVQTSGSTGAPKLISLPYSQLVRSARRTNSFFHVTKNSHLHCAVSFQYIGGKMMIVRSLISGAQLSFSEPSLCPSLPEGDFRIKLMSVVPAQMSFILNHLEKFKRVENFLIGGSNIDSRLWNKIVKSGINAWESYGMTETASHIAIRHIAGSSQSRPNFVPLKGIKLSLEPDGCLSITDRDISIKTNDIAEFGPKGGFKILGRKDDIIISGGLKLNPSELEEKLEKYIGDLCNFYLSSVPDEIWSSRLVLVAISADDNPLVNESLIEQIKNRIAEIPEDLYPKRLRPKEIRIATHLPLTSSGKLLRNLSSSKLTK